MLSPLPAASAAVVNAFELVLLIGVVATIGLREVERLDTGRRELVRVAEG